MTGPKTNDTPAAPETTHREESRTSGQFVADRAADSAPGNRVSDEDLRERQERLLDEAIEETFPASDPISPKRITK
ncbi:MAG: hypothetical protein K2Y56_15605 [Methylobacterium sp.]|uniref:hypothetical protein n=1 Tax=Methylobacterium sp. TaxID=409 RepID=UPI0025CE7450|nr:hypothetical protein [Methylobacterium sp.]MBX9932940.1 hypothetical protein [Methylobacterium sp.]